MLCAAVTCSEVRILHQDAHVLAVDKPAGVLVVPGRGVAGPALSAMVREIAPDALPVHRLDRDTSGVVLFAVTREAHRALNAAFEERRAEKTYFALVRGDLAKAQHIDLPLREAQRRFLRAEQLQHVLDPAHRVVLRLRDYVVGRDREEVVGLVDMSGDRCRCLDRGQST